MINNKQIPLTKLIKEFMQLEATSGLLMLVTAGIALFMANSSYSNNYYQLVNLPITIEFGGLIFAKPLNILVNELLMALFFLVVGLEIKEELIEGNLSTKSQAMLPLLAAIAGVIMPAIVFYLVNRNNCELLKGWAIPTVTDIAFAVCILSFFRRHIAPYLRVFLLSLAIFDDLIGILIIAIFYSHEIVLNYLLLAGAVSCLLMVCNLRGIASLKIYLLLGAFLWYFMLKSGVHATISGVVLALTIPLKVEEKRFPLKAIMHNLHPWVSYFIIPFFAFVNAGISFTEFPVNQLFNSLTLGVFLGLFTGKQIGVFSCCLLLIKTGLVKLPFRLPWLQLYGVSILTGIGFTVSLFINQLAFSSTLSQELAKMGIILGSLVSALFALIVLKISVIRASK